MKKILILSCFIIQSICFIVAQSPESFKYQAMLRNTSGELIIEENVSIKISIIQSTISGAEVYTEEHSVSTNSFGLVNLNIGEGTTSDLFNSIDWANGPYFVKIELDANGGTSYTEMGTSQLLSVPYALYATKAYEAENTFSGDYNDLLNTPHIPEPFSGSYDDLLNKPTLFSGNYHDLINKPDNFNDNDADPTNEIQNLNEILSVGNDASGIGIENLGNTTINGNITFLGEGTDFSGYTKRISGNDYTDISQPYGVSLILEAGGGDVRGADVHIKGGWTAGVDRGGNIYLEPGAGNENNDGNVITNKNLCISDSNKGLIMTSPDGQCWQLHVNNSGNITTTSITCPE